MFVFIVNVVNIIFSGLRSHASHEAFLKDNNVMFFDQ